MLSIQQHNGRGEEIILTGTNVLIIRKGNQYFKCTILKLDIVFIAYLVMWIVVLGPLTVFIYWTH